jgi:hypothetical protein
MIHVDGAHPVERIATPGGLGQSMGQDRGVHTTREGDQQTSAGDIEQLITSVRYRIH